MQRHPDVRGENKKRYAEKNTRVSATGKKGGGCGGSRRGEGKIGTGANECHGTQARWGVVGGCTVRMCVQISLCRCLLCLMCSCMCIVLNAGVGVVVVVVAAAGGFGRHRPGATSVLQLATGILRLLHRLVEMRRGAVGRVWCGVWEWACVWSYSSRLISSAMSWNLSRRMGVSVPAACVVCVRLMQGRCVVTTMEGRGEGA